MDERGSGCSYLALCEPTAVGTGTARSGGQEDPVELDSSLGV